MHLIPYWRTTNHEKEIKANLKESRNIGEEKLCTITHNLTSDKRRWKVTECRRGLTLNRCIMFSFELTLFSDNTILNDVIDYQTESYQVYRLVDKYQITFLLQSSSVVLITQSLMWKIVINLGVSISLYDVGCWIIKSK